MQEYLTMSAMAMARVRPVRSAAMRIMAGRGRLEYLTMSPMAMARVRPVRSAAMRMMEGRGGKEYLTMSAMAIARVRPVRSAAMRMLAGRGRPGIPYYERHGDGEGETGEERSHEDDGR
jgi:hypothetical protein